ncbi:P-loop containing nucleoside triphosphate hydrolases superfamily protein [Actinidia rufa]|uniref:P-loop containing nucleoside triphosphate hydrolases superfamily protein n=1 Tax=Actinidia rufa TaxID=165716 RepID=A0A7J0GG30_9ERIC|nr:P-loop containing nucleoside triphosphate hydrolases superfamily protein [Actinidia rufa]
MLQSHILPCYYFQYHCYQSKAFAIKLLASPKKRPQTENNALSKLATQLNEKTFDLEIRSADNRILQEQLQLKVSENAGMQETILLLRQQLDSLLSKKTCNCPRHPADIGLARQKTCAEESSDTRYEWKDGSHAYEETCIDESTPTSVMSLNRIFSQEESKEFNSNTSLHSKLLMQAAEIETLKQEKVEINEEKDRLEIHSQKLSEEASYAKELAADAAVELRNLAEEVTKLTYQNAKLTADLAAANEASCRSNCCQRPASFDMKQNRGNGACLRKYEDNELVEDLQQELNRRYQREASLVTTLSEREKIEDELRKRLDEAKRHEEDLENELANMWLLVAEMRKSDLNFEDPSSLGDHASNVLQMIVGNGFSSNNGLPKKAREQDIICENIDEKSTFEELKANYHRERRRCKELENLVLRLKVHPSSLNFLQ